MATLKLSENNLYSDGYIINLSSIQILARDPISYEAASLKDRVHTVKDEDTIWQLAYQYYQDAKLWFIIADVNDNIINPFELPVGEDILIPDLDTIRTLR